MACLKSFTRQAGDVPPGNAFRMQQPRLWRRAARFQPEQKGPNCPQPANPCQRSRSARSVWRASGYCPRGGARPFQAAAMCEPSKGMDLSETDNCSADAAAWKGRAPDGRARLAGGQNPGKKKGRLGQGPPEPPQPNYEQEGGPWFSPPPHPARCRRRTCNAANPRMNHAIAIPRKGVGTASSPLIGLVTLLLS